MGKTCILVLCFVVSYSPVLEVQFFEGQYHFFIRYAFDVQMKSDYMTIMALGVVYIATEMSLLIKKISSFLFRLKIRKKTSSFKHVA